MTWRIFVKQQVDERATSLSTAISGSFFVMIKFCCLVPAGHPMPKTYGGLMRYGQSAQAQTLAKIESRFPQFGIMACSLMA